MSNIPYQQIYWADYFSKTRHLSCEQHGAYLQLIGAMWLAGGFLPSDPRALARIVGCTPTRWAKIGSDVLAFFTENDGQISHERLTSDLQKAREKKNIKAISGSQGGRAKSLKYNKPRLAYASDLPKHSQKSEEERLLQESKPFFRREDAEARADSASADRSSVEGLSLDEVKARIAQEAAEIAAKATA